MASLVCERIKDGNRIAMLGLGALVRNPAVVVVAQVGKFLYVAAIGFGRRTQLRRNGREIAGRRRGTVGKGTAVVVVVLQALGRERAVLVEAAGFEKALVERALLEGAGLILWEVAVLIVDVRCRVVWVGMTKCWLVWHWWIRMRTLILMGMRSVLALGSGHLARKGFSRLGLEEHIVFVLDGACQGPRMIGAGKISQAQKAVCCLKGCLAMVRLWCAATCRWVCLLARVAIIHWNTILHKLRFDLREVRVEGLRTVLG